VTVTSDTDADADLERARINGETARIPWRDLQRFFAAGKVIFVHPELDLVEVALVISRDDAATLGAWQENGRVGQVRDRQAREWLDADALMWSVVVKPWVLAQPILADAPQGAAGRTDTPRKHEPRP
jgi:hypothetical protein